MLEMGTSGSMSGEGKPSAASRSRSSALPRLYGVFLNSQGGIVDGVALCRMFHRAIRAPSLPKYLSSDHDPLYRFHQWQANLRVLEITEIKSVPYVNLHYAGFSQDPSDDAIVHSLVREEPGARRSALTLVVKNGGCRSSN
jgi:hypothetical protein